MCLHFFQQVIQKTLPTKDTIANVINGLQAYNATTNNLFEPERKKKLYSLERARIVPIIPRARIARGTTDKPDKPTINQEDMTMTDVLNAYWLASAAHSAACRACRAGRRAGADDATRSANRERRKAAYAALRAAYDALRATYS